MALMTPPWAGPGRCIVVIADMAVVLAAVLVEPGAFCAQCGIQNPIVDHCTVTAVYDRH